MATGESFPVNANLNCKRFDLSVNELVLHAFDVLVCSAVFSSRPLTVPSDMLVSRSRCVFRLETSHVLSADLLYYFHRLVVSFVIIFTMI